MVEFLTKWLFRTEFISVKLQYNYINVRGELPKCQPGIGSLLSGEDDDSL